MVDKESQDKVYAHIQNTGLKNYRGKIVPFNAWKKYKKRSPCASAEVRHPLGQGRHSCAVQLCSALTKDDSDMKHEWKENATPRRGK